ncbi:MAG: hypothetical protein IH626_18230, partial [Rhodospirillales bacterium]|nr:hypothetical protein [Rhodospirillales bacterium]
VQAAAARALDALTKAAPGAAGSLPLDVRKRGGVIAKAMAQERDEETAARIADDFLGPAAAGAAEGWEGLRPTLVPVAGIDEEEPPAGKPATEAQPGGHPVAAPGTPAPWRKILEVMEGGEAEALQDLVELIPEDPEGAADELKQAMVELGLSFLPGVGNLLSAAQTYRAIVAAYKALKDDNLAKALEHGGDAAINAIGAIPGLGNLAKAGVRGVEATQAMVKVLRGKKAIAATQTTTRVGSSVADTAFAHWVRNLFGGTTRAVGKTEKVGSLRPEVSTFLEAKGIKVQTDGIEAIDHKITRMERKGKPLEKHAPREVIESIPEVLRNPDEILWDGKALLYVRNIKEEVAAGAQVANPRDRVKLVVNVNYGVHVQTGAGKASRVGNWVWSAGRVPATTLANRRVYERVWP